MKNPHASQNGPKEEEVVLRARRGNPEATDIWLRRDYPEVFRLCLGLLGNYATAEDMAQEAMIKIMDRWQDWNSQRSFRAWRNALVTNLCRDRLRHMARHQTAALGDDSCLRIDSDPAATLKSRDIRTALMEALSTLPEREREVFVLRDLEGLGTGEVAATLGIAASTVRSFLTLARRRLKGLLARRLNLDGVDDR